MHFDEIGCDFVFKIFITLKLAHPTCMKMFLLFTCYSRCNVETVLLYKHLVIVIILDVVDSAS